MPQTDPSIAVHLMLKEIEPLKTPKSHSEAVRSV